VEVWLFVYTFVGTSRGHLCDCTAFLYNERLCGCRRSGEGHPSPFPVYGSWGFAPKFFFWNMTFKSVYFSTFCTFWQLSTSLNLCVFWFKGITQISYRLWCKSNGWPLRQVGIQTIQIPVPPPTATYLSFYHDFISYFVDEDRMINSSVIFMIDLRNGVCRPLKTFAPIISDNQPT